MNLNSIVSGAIASVNPRITINGNVCTGYTVGANYVQVPTYQSIKTTGQVQTLTASDLKMLGGLNIQNVELKVYLDGNYEGVFRNLGTGGDTLTFCYGSICEQTYLVTAVLERWQDWSCLGVTAQVTA